MTTKPKGLGRTILQYIPVLLIVALFFFPLFWMFSTSFKQRVDWYAVPPRILSFTPTLQNYDQLLSIAIVPLQVLIDPATGQPKINKLTNEPQLQRPSQVLPSDEYRELTRFNLFGQWYLVGTKSEFLRFIFNSIVISLATTVFSIIMACLTAYGFSRFPPRRSDNILFWILSLRMLPPVAVIVPYFFMFQAFGMLDKHLTLILVYSVFNISFGVWLLKGFFDEISPELEEAAMMDGYGPWAVFRKVALPLVVPGIATVAVFNIIQSTNEFLLAFVLTQNVATTGPVALTKFLPPTGIDWGGISAAATLLVAPVVVFTILVRNQLIRGMSFGQLR
jgi:ABC-type glycerol-3-phosphate transport system permease component